VLQILSKESFDQVVVEELKKDVLEFGLFLLLISLHHIA